jgi:hypothetical protein
MPALFADSRHLADHIRHDGRATSQGDAATGRFVGGTNYIGSCSYGCLNNGSKFMDEMQNQESDAPPQVEKAQAFAEKFNLPLDKAKRLIELHRAVVAREVKKPKKR